MVNILSCAKYAEIPPSNVRAGALRRAQDCFGLNGRADDRFLRFTGRTAKLRLAS